jgi:hypothetical protein
MKKLLFVPILLLCLGMISCKKEAVPEQQVYMQQKNMPIINPGLLLFGTCDNWYVSLLQTGRTDLTNNYKSVNLTFCPDNTFVVSNDILAVSGNWYITLDKGNPIILILDLNYPVDTYPVERPAALWSELNGEWKIVRLQKNMISLQIDEQKKRLILERGVLY